MTGKGYMASVALALVAAVGLAGIYRFTSGAGEETRASAATPPAQPVRVVAAEQHVFERTVSVQGTVSAKRYANVPARVFGTLDAVFVDEGDGVVAGETKLFQVERDNLARAARIAEQDRAVARYAEQEAQANVERVDADLEKATIDYERFQRLFEKKAATQEMLEQYTSRFKQVSAQHKYAVAVADLAAEKARQAAVALEIAEKNLADSVIVAPLSGVVTHRMAEPGEIAENGKPVLRIEDLSLLEVSAHLAASDYAAVLPGETAMRVAVNGVDAGSHPVAYKSPTIHPQLRTFEVRCLLESPAPVIAPGALASVTLPLERDEALGVPVDAVLTRGGQSVVFVVENGAARMVPVEPGLLSDGWIAVRGEGLEAGACVVAMGQDMLNEGTPVTVQEGGH